MAEQHDYLNKLEAKLEMLQRRQDEFSREISALRNEIYRLKTNLPQERYAPAEHKPAPVAIEIKTPVAAPAQPAQQSRPAPAFQPAFVKPKQKSDLEKFIGENLINKIGIAITVIGVAIGAKYAIDHDWISPLTRIILGYLFGLGLLGFALKLKRNYHNFSAVLLSGAMAILYFITFAAYDFYSLVPQAAAFAIMALITVFTVGAAIRYDQQVIAHIGMVGAYAVPFLLSDGSGRIAVLFSYMAIINVGILAVAFRKYWKPLYYASFLLTWLIYFFWYNTKYESNSHFNLALLFLFIFYVIFYLIFLGYKLLKSEVFRIDDILLLLANSFIFYAIGYDILSNSESASRFLGLFTIGNAIVHLLAALAVYYRKAADKNLFYMVSGLVLVFFTIAIPVQLNGNWVTLLWAGEAALLFWIGRTRAAAVYEGLSYVLMLMAFLSIIQDWSTVYYEYIPGRPETRITPLLNIHFASSLLFSAAFAYINVLHFKPKFRYCLPAGAAVVSIALPVLLVISIYMGFRMELENYWMQLYSDSVLVTGGAGTNNPVEVHNNAIPYLQTVWVLIYSLIFVSVLALLNIRKFRNQLAAYIILSVSVITLVVFFAQGFYTIGELRTVYMEQMQVKYYPVSAFYIGIRYVAILAAALTLLSIYRLARQEYMNKDLKIAFDLIIHGSILWISSSELINWLELAHSTQSYKLGLSILWGCYSLFLIVLGIWKKAKALRIAAIALFGVTLVKLFVYDIADLDTIAKTIVFVSLGILLLIISFLYNKYKNAITPGQDAP